MTKTDIELCPNMNKEEQDDLAALPNTSRRSAQHRKKAESEGIPEAMAAVASVSTTGTIADASSLVGHILRTWA